MADPKKRFCFECQEREATLQVYCPWYGRFEDMCDKKECWFKGADKHPLKATEGPVTCFTWDEHILTSQWPPGYEPAEDAKQRRMALIDLKSYEPYFISEGKGFYPLRTMHEMKAEMDADKRLIGLLKEELALTRAKQHSAELLVESLQRIT